ncbi:MAG: trypsin-like peptidase domain-containing protein [Bacteroidia bacterium]|nr:trypsin-like peptidase domain-containing protein [Bacteroidia bacterium]MDW8235373.1 trypsin-like peptidase domain-containing protein [Bacteroidia bacterium]
MRKWLPLIVVGLFAGIVSGVSVYLFTSARPQALTPVIVPITPTRFQELTEEKGNFAEAARKAIASVVFIRAYGERVASEDFWNFWEFWMPRSQRIYSAGSGVVWSRDGYIVTNFHVVREANKILVSFPDKRILEAELIGADASTDIALLRVKASGLIPLSLANSDSVQIGEWVLAVGNPYNLTYTVTAGIISARGRNLRLLQGKSAPESFLQTDAAINPGNSGGALVNLNGQLVGINTAIASQTGSYVGYGFAIPSNIVRKVVEDLQKYGQVQRAYLDAEVADLPEEGATDASPEELQGVHVLKVYSGGSAEKAGLRAGDKILRVEGFPVQTEPELLERIAQYRPGDKVKITYRRAGRIYETYLTLTNEEGETTLLKREVYHSEKLGADLVAITGREAQRLGIQRGYRIQNLRAGVLAQLGLTEGFIMVSLNNYVPSSAKELEEILLKVRGRLTIQGVDAYGRSMYLRIERW